MATEFFRRWSRNKLEETEAEVIPAEVEESTAPQPAEPEPDGPEQEATLASVLAEGVEKEVKKAAMRKLFLSAEFSEVDALNDYDHDYKAVGNLSSELAGQLRDWAKEQLEDAGPEEAAVEQAAVEQAAQQEAGLEEVQIESASLDNDPDDECGTKCTT